MSTTLRLVAASLSLALGFATAACHSTTVVHVSNGVPNEGIAFFPLLPVNQEVLQYQQRWMKVDINVYESVALDAKTWKDVTITTSMFICGSNSEELRTAVDSVRDAFKGVQRDHTDVMDTVQKAAKGACSEPAPWSRPITIAYVGEVPRAAVADQRTIQQLPATDFNYINIEAPYGGSASVDIKLDARGVMAEASAQRQDQLPAAIAGAIGTIAGAALTAAGTALAPAAAAAPTMQVQINLAPRAKGREAPEAVVTAVTIVATPVGRTYTLTTVWPVRARSASNFNDVSPNPCLKLASFESHDGGCTDAFSIQSDPQPTTPAQPPPPSTKQ